MDNNEDNKIIHKAQEIITYHHAQVQEFIEHRFEAKENDLLIAQELLGKLSKAYEALNNPSEGREKKLQILYEVSAAFENANREKNESSGEKDKMDLNELRSDKWWSFLVTEAGEKTLNEVILGFMQEDQKVLSDLSSEMQKN